MRLCFFAALVHFAMLLAVPARAREASLECKGGAVHLSCNSSSPLLDATRTLRRQGIYITFEEAPVEYRGDLIDRTAPSYQPRNSNDRSWDSRGGPLEVKWTAPNCNRSLDDPRNAIEAILSAYQRAGYPGEYGIEQLGTVWHVVPRSVRGIDGNVVSTKPILDNTIVVSLADRSVLQYITEVIKAAAQANGREAGIAMGPTNWLMQTKTNAGCDGKRARECLQDILRRDDNQHTFEMPYSFRFHKYFLNIF